MDDELVVAIQDLSQFILATPPLSYRPIAILLPCFLTLHSFLNYYLESNHDNCLL